VDENVVALYMMAWIRASLLLGLVTVSGGSRSAVHQQPLQTQLQPWLSQTVAARDGPTLSAHRRLEVLRGGAAPVGAPAAQLDEAPLRAPRRTKPAQQPPAAKAAKSEPLAAAPVPHVTKKLQHVLVVEAGEADQDGSTALLHPKKLAQLGLMEGDIVRLKGKRDRDTLCTAQESAAVPEGSVVLSAVTRTNLNLNLGETTKAYRCDSVKNGERLVVLPFADAMGGLSAEEVHEQLVKPYFLGAEGEEAPYRPVQEGDLLRLRHGAQLVECKVVECEPPRCIVAPETTLELPERTLDRAEEAAADELGYDDIGGVDKELSKIRELVELPMRHPKVFTSVGVRPPRGVLIHGPPGCGKTMIAKAVAAETGAYFFLINGPEVMSKMAGESEQKLRQAFEECEKNSPAILFIDELDAIAPRRDKAQGEVEKRIVSQMLTLMDGISPKSQVVVMAATNRPNAVEPALRRFGRFDLEINIPVPDTAGRLDILRIKTREMRLSPEVDLEALSQDTQGYCGADLAQMVFEAAMQCVRDKLPEMDLEADRLPKKILDSLQVSPEHFRRALKLTNPSTLRENAIEMPNVKWEDIGGLEDVKRELKETVQYPVQYADKFELFGMNAAKGVLFYGPPGCGKTLLAKAIANECQANFISVKGPELLTKWFGESEANVRELFDKARQASPCVIFFDEMDSIAKARGSGGGGASEAGDRVINQILTEIDGVGARKSVFVIGATNRPDILDPAIMRPGRLDQLIYIPLPDFDSRLSIFRANLRKSPVAPDLDLRDLANRTEGFSGADITEVCQRACKLAIRGEIAAQEAAEAAAIAKGEPPPEVKAEGLLSKAHFDDAMRTARKSVSKTELARYLKFKKELEGGKGIAQAMAAGASDDPSEEASAAAPQPSPPPAAAESGKGDDEDLYA
jgi:transitional endoplasmic reticulum ATPase